MPGTMKPIKTKRRRKSGVGGALVESFSEGGGLGSGRVFRYVSRHRQTTAAQA